MSLRRSRRSHSRDVFLIYDHVHRLLTLSLHLGLRLLLQLRSLQNRSSRSRPLPRFCRRSRRDDRSILQLDDSSLLAAPRRRRPLLLSHLPSSILQPYSIPIPFKQPSQVSLSESRRRFLFGSVAGLVRRRRGGRDDGRSRKDGGGFFDGSEGFRDDVGKVDGETCFLHFGDFVDLTKDGSFVGRDESSDGSCCEFETLDREGGFAEEGEEEEGSI